MPRSVLRRSNRYGLDVLWARGVTPTCGVPFQCISRRFLPSEGAALGRLRTGSTRRARDRMAARPDQWSGWLRPGSRARLLSPSLRRASPSLVAALAGASRRCRAAAAVRDSRGSPRSPDRGWELAGRRVPAGAAVRGTRRTATARATAASTCARSTTPDVRAPADGVVAFVGHGRRTRHPHHRPWRRARHDARAGRRARSQVGRRSWRGRAVGDAGARRSRRAGRAALRGAAATGEYINPLLLLGGVPRAVLLPCC